ncbi:MAG: phosphoribosylpyrophosphate synthetase [Alphaproteobacteria bacterium]|nr:MAG: phosphoribosylpyrophosphate synthetase [Alphaproteobacteria bacterium]
MAIVFSFPGFEAIANSIAGEKNMQRGDVTVRQFPDGESYVRLNSPVQGQDVIIVCGLDNPDRKIMALMFFAHTARKMGAGSIGLVAPYLGYMRQDKEFQDGEAVTADIFAAFLSQMVDWLVTIDPHLHRHEKLNEIYSIPSMAIHANDLIAEWIRANINHPLLIGPDKESEQWVSEVAKKATAPFIILTKTRRGDRDVEVSIPDLANWRNHTPVLIDDIISTAGTMITTAAHLKDAGMKPPVCIGVHGIFAGDAYEKLLASDVEKIITCNSIRHKSNGIALENIIVTAVIKISGPDPKNLFGND